jgi:pyruvate/2-oxoglutarate/acetoin dehydrogenase E1 component
MHRTLGMGIDGGTAAGSDVTIVSYSRGMAYALEAAKRLRI